MSSTRVRRGTCASGPASATRRGWFRSRSGSDAVCGVALIVGPGADPALFRQMLSSLAPRGETEEALEDGLVLAGTQRLRIVDRERAVQPWLSPGGRWLLCYNGEIFNYRKL